MRFNGNKGFWQLSARFYDRSVKRTSRAAYARICELIRRKLKPEMYVLELGCGTGQLSFPLSGSVELWDATDFSKAMIKAANRRSHNSGGLRFLVQDAGNLPYEHDTFDAVVIANVLHILPEPERVMREIRRVLKPGGLLFAPTYVHGGGRKPSRRMALLKLCGLRIYQRWTAAELKSFLTENGFAADTVVILPDTVAPLCYIDGKSTK